MHLLQSVRSLHIGALLSLNKTVSVNWLLPTKLFIKNFEIRLSSYWVINQGHHAASSFSLSLSPLKQLNIRGLVQSNVALPHSVRLRLTFARECVPPINVRLFFILAAARTKNNNNHRPRTAEKSLIARYIHWVRAAAEEDTHTPVPDGWRATVDLGFMVSELNL